MTVFDIYEHPERGPDCVVAVPEGFAPLALAFTVLWALWHRMWIVAAGLVVLFAGITLAVSHGGLPPAVAMILDFGVALIFGFEANALRGLSLRWAGYRHVAMMSARDAEVAELQHILDRRVLSATVRAGHERAPMRPSNDMLGLFGNV